MLRGAAPHACERPQPLAVAWNPPCMVEKVNIAGQLRGRVLAAPPPRMHVRGRSR